ncbi:MAG: hypothetical protein Q8P56_06970 [Candidatus Uhrbacteria bacterium]|nr:hypothetical protein [Candidatus Uhrbacteria bacterium]
MFDLIEEELSKKKEPLQEGPVFSEEANPIYTMPSTFRRSMPKASGGKLMFIIFGSLFGLAIIGTGIFLYLSSQKQPPAQQQVEQPVEQPVQEQPSAQAQTPTDLQPAPVAQTEQQPTEGQEQQTQGTEQPQPVEQEQKPQPLLGVDTDQDGLTDVEERLYSTDPAKSDTDADGFSDGNELKNQYDPLKAETRLDVSGIVNTYTNQTFKYALLYPSSWVAKANDPTSNREVMISSASGEFFTISVQDNSNKLSPVDWYTTVVTSAGDTSRLQSFAYDTWSGVMTEDSLTVYLTRNEKDSQAPPLMYVIKYSLNTKNEVNFITTFQMMLRSFIFTDLSFVK